MNERSRVDRNIPEANMAPPTSNKPIISAVASDKSIPGLIKELANDITTLFTQEVALAKSEVTHSIHAAKTGAIGVLTGASILYAGFLCLLLAAIAGLNQIMDFWLSALVVGGVVAIIGFAMIQTGKKKLEPTALKPEHSLNSIRKDRDAIKGATR